MINRLWRTYRQLSVALPHFALSASRGKSGKWRYNHTATILTLRYSTLWTLVLKNWHYYFTTDAFIVWWYLYMQVSDDFIANLLWFCQCMACTFCSLLCTQHSPDILLHIHLYGMMLSQIFQRVWRWTHFEKPLRIGKVIDVSLVYYLFGTQCV